MKREADKIAEKLKESEKKLESVEQQIQRDPISGAPLKLHPPNRNKPIEAKIAEINKKIQKTRNKRTKRNLISKRDALQAELNWGPKQLNEAFNGAYRSYRVDGIRGVDPGTFLDKIKRFLVKLMLGETQSNAVRVQSTIWIRFTKDGVEIVDLAFNSRMLNVYNMSDMDEIAEQIVNHTLNPIENPALANSKFVFEEVLRMDINFHHFNLTRGSSYLPLPDKLARKGAIINPKNSDLLCFKWAIIATMKWRELGSNPQRVSKLMKLESELIGIELDFQFLLRTFETLK